MIYAVAKGKDLNGVLIEAAQYLKYKIIAVVPGAVEVERLVHMGSGLTSMKELVIGLHALLEIEQL